MWDLQIIMESCGIWNQPGYRNKGKGKAGDGQDIRKEKDSPEPVPGCLLW